MYMGPLAKYKNNSKLLLWSLISYVCLMLNLGCVECIQPAFAETHRFDWECLPSLLHRVEASGQSDGHSLRVKLVVLQSRCDRRIGCDLVPDVGKDRVMLSRNSSPLSRRLPFGKKEVFIDPST